MFENRSAAQARIHPGRESFELQLATACNAMSQDDATGHVYGFFRSGSLVMKEIADLEWLLEGGYEQYELILFDGGNTHGDSWKHFFQPLVLAESFISES